MKIFKAFMLAFMLLFGLNPGTVHALSPSCVSNINASYSIWHENFMSAWRNSDYALPVLRVLEEEEAQRFIKVMNAAPPVTNIVADTVYIYTQDQSTRTGITFVTDGCVVWAGVTLNTNVQSWLDAIDINAPPFHLRLNPHLQEAIYEKGNAF
jgi:hypothetical protein